MVDGVRAKKSLLREKWPRNEKVREAAFFGEEANKAKGHFGRRSVSDVSP